MAITSLDFGRKISASLSSVGPKTAENGAFTLLGSVITGPVGPPTVGLIPEKYACPVVRFPEKHYVVDHQSG